MIGHEDYGRKESFGVAEGRRRHRKWLRKRHWKRHWKRHRKRLLHLRFLFKSHSSLSLFLLTLKQRQPVVKRVKKFHVKMPFCENDCFRNKIFWNASELLDLQVFLSRDRSFFSFSWDNSELHNNGVQNCLTFQITIIIERAVEAKSRQAILHFLQKRQKRCIEEKRESRVYQESLKSREYQSLKPREYQSLNPREYQSLEPQVPPQSVLFNTVVHHGSQSASTQMMPTVVMESLLPKIIVFAKKSCGQTFLKETKTSLELSVRRFKLHFSQLCNNSSF